MGGSVIVGAQWGDEGKGKITDILAETADLVVRFQGGNNAGHTVVVGKEVYKFHLLPSGVVHGKEVRIASGVVLDPEVLINELKLLKEKGIDPHMKIDPRTHIILPFHKELDGARESSAKEEKIGTTLRGIGPCYEDRSARIGLRFGDLIDPPKLKKRLTSLFPKKKVLLSKVYQRDNLQEETILKEYTAFGMELAPLVGDVSREVYDGLKEEKEILFESAQGTLLDLSFGTYPYVTSSHPIAGSVFVNVGIPPQNLKVIGVAKAYTTRVGEGPFPTELNEEVGEQLRSQGNEFGTTTGRPRRCGWLDLTMLRYANRLNGFTEIALTKLDVLSGLKTLKVCTSYDFRGDTIEFPSDIDVLKECKPVYTELNGFSTTSNIDTYEELDTAAREYIRFIEEDLNVPVTMISIGPGRAQTLYKTT